MTASTESVIKQMPPISAPQNAAVPPVVGFLSELVVIVEVVVELPGGCWLPGSIPLLCFSLLHTLHRKRGRERRRSDSAFGVPLRQVGLYSLGLWPRGSRSCDRGSRQPSFRCCAMLMPDVLAGLSVHCETMHAPSVFLP